MSASMDMSKLIAGIQQHRERQLTKAVKAVDVFGEHVIGDSAQLAPVDKGPLKASATTEPAVFDGTTITKRIGHNVHYGAIVHEDLEAHHDNGQAKFLETAIRNNAPKMAPFVAGRLAGE